MGGVGKLKTARDSQVTRGSDSLTNSCLGLVASLDNFLGNVLFLVCVYLSVCLGYLCAWRQKKAWGALLELQAAVCYLTQVLATPGPSGNESSALKLPAISPAPCQVFNTNFVNQLDSVE